MLDTRALTDALAKPSFVGPDGTTYEGRVLSYPEYHAALALVAQADAATGPEATELLRHVVAATGYPVDVVLGLPAPVATAVITDFFAHQRTAGQPKAPAAETAAGA